MKRLPHLVLILVMAGCAPDANELDLNFPSLDTFLYSSFARVQVFDVSPGELGLCPTLVGQAVRASTSRPSSYDTGEMPVCDFRHGGVVFGDVGSGPKAFVAVVSDASNRVLLSGCTMSEVYEDAPGITIRLFMTDRYHEVVADIGELDCTDMDDKCERGCSR